MPETITDPAAAAAEYRTLVTSLADALEALMAAADAEREFRDLRVRASFSHPFPEVPHELRRLGQYENPNSNLRLWLGAIRAALAQTGGGPR